MSQKSGTATFLQPSVNTEDPNKRSRISYTREFLLSLDKADIRVKLPREDQLFISCVFQDAPGLLSPPPFCVPDSRCYKSVPQNSPKVPDTINHILHRSSEPYLPPCRYKALSPSSRDSNDLLNSDTSGSSECTNQEKAEHERWTKLTKDGVRLPKEDKWYSSKNTGSKECSEVFLMSSTTANLTTLQSTSNAITKHLHASPKLNMIQEAVRGDAFQPSILPETTKSCSTRCQPVQVLITDESVNLWQKSVNHVDTSWHFLSVLDKDMHLGESEAYSNFVVGHPEGTPHVMESLKKSRPPSFLSQENCGNMKKSHCEVAYEKGIMELQLSELNKTSICDGSPGRSAIREPSEACVFFPIEDEKHLQGVKQATSVSMKQNPSSLGFQIQQDLELNSFSSSLDGRSNSTSELCLPDEDSLITFDEPFLMPDEENSTVVDSSMSSPERNPIESDAFSPSSPREMIEKLVESILNDESSPPPLLDDPKVHHGAGLEGFCHSLYAQQSYPRFCSSQLNPGGDQQAHDSFKRNNIDSATYSFLTPHSFPSNTISQPFLLAHDELRFDYEVRQSMFHQMINPGKLHLCSLCVSQSGVTPHLPTLQMASCSEKLNSMLCCTLGYQEASYTWGFIRPNLDSHGDSNINQAAVDSQRARNWHPYVGGFW